MTAAKRHVCPDHPCAAPEPHRSGREHTVCPGCGSHDECVPCASCDVTVAGREQQAVVAQWSCPKCGEEFVVVPDQARIHERLCKPVCSCGEFDCEACIEDAAAEGREQMTGSEAAAYYSRLQRERKEREQEVPPVPRVHWYTSTACLHLLHDRCRETCKFCSRPCLCKCHQPAMESDDL